MSELISDVRRSDHNGVCQLRSECGVVIDLHIDRYLGHERAEALLEQAEASGEIRSPPGHEGNGVVDQTSTEKQSASRA